MATKLFAGPNALDSILLVTKSTDSKLLKKYNALANKYIFYSPWMSVPTTVKGSIEFHSEEEIKERFLNPESLLNVKRFISQISPVKEQIPTLENYNLYISTPEKDLLFNFNKKIREAELELKRIHPFFEELINNLVKFYVPMENPSDQHEFDYGMSVMWFKGAIFFEKRQFPSLHRRVENLAHEIAHQIIINYQINDFLIHGDLNAKVYSGIRQTERPAIMAFHGAAALSYMLLIAKTYQDQTRSEELRNALQQTLDSLNNIEFTRVGRKIFEEMHEFL